MTDSKNSSCPYGSEYQLYWEMRHNLFSRFDEAKVDATGLYTMVPELFAMDMANRAIGAVSLDICSGIGSMAIALARAGQRVTAIEIDENRVAMARHNAEIYNVSEQIDFRVADVTDPAAIESLPGNVDTVFMDPPWGPGPGAYLKRPVTRLEDLQLAGMDLRALLRNIECSEVMMRLPPNFDIGVLHGTGGEKIAYVTQAGYLHWYFIRIPKSEFIALPDSSPAHLGLEQAREGFVPHYVSG